MSKFELVLLVQSPALFFAGLSFLVSHFIRRKNHKIRAALDMILCLICIAGGQFLYYLGMLTKQFTIHNFWHIRTHGWIGLGVVVVLVLFFSCHSAVKLVRKRRAEKLAAQKDAEHARQLEAAKIAAYESGKADALAAEKVVDTVAAAVEEPASEAEAPAEEAPAVEAKKEPAKTK